MENKVKMVVPKYCTNFEGEVKDVWSRDPCVNGKLGMSKFAAQTPIYIGKSELMSPELKLDQKIAW